MKHAVVLAIILIICNFLFCNAYKWGWDDCGTPLTKVIYYDSVTLSPYPQNQITPGGTLSINIDANLLLGITDLATQLQVWKDGVLFMDVQIANLCEILSYSNVQCPLVFGQSISFTYAWTIPQLLYGSYDIKILNLDSSYDIVGCVEAVVLVDGLGNEQCTFNSTFTAIGAGLAHYLEASYEQVNGDWIQIGPYGSEAGSSAESFEWGTFLSITGTPDITTTMTNPPYVWGINGTMYSLVTMPNSANVIHNYEGEFVVAYQYQDGSLLFVAQGTFDWSFEISAADESSTLLSGTFTLDPQYSFPSNFTYPIPLGNLNPLTLARTSDGLNLIVSGNTQFCSCGVDICGVCGGDGLSCFGKFVETIGPKENGTLYVDGAIAIGVVGAVAVILAIIFFVFQSRYRNPIVEPDLIDPNKPDYGAMAINEVIDEVDNEN